MGGIGPKSSPVTNGARATRAPRPPAPGANAASLDRWLELLRLLHSASALLQHGQVSNAGEVLAQACACAQGVGRRWGMRWALRGTAPRGTRSLSLVPAGRDMPERSRDRADVLDPAPEAVSAPISIRALGEFELTIDGIRFAGGIKPQRKPLELLKLLLLSDAAPLGAAQLADELWPDSEGDTARNCLQVAVHRLRRLLGYEAALIVHDRKLRLDPRLCWVDVWSLEHEAKRLAQLPIGDANLSAHATRVLRLYRGHLFAHEPEQPWMLAPRERLRRCWLDLVRRLGQYHELRGDWQRACDLYQRTVELDPLAEDIYRRVMQCQHKTGERAEALHTYLRCREQLGATLGVSPSRETEQVYQSLRAAP